MIKNAKATKKKLQANTLQCTWLFAALHHALTRNFEQETNLTTMRRNKNSYEYAFSMASLRVRKNGRSDIAIMFSKQTPPYGAIGMSRLSAYESNAKSHVASKQAQRQKRIRL